MDQKVYRAVQAGPRRVVKEISVRYLEEREILIVHALIIDATGGRHGVRDQGLLLSASERPKTALFGEEKFKTVFEKAAVYLESLARHHVFVDGNKRTSLAAAIKFLEANGYYFTASNRLVENFVIRVVVDRYGVDKIALWLKKYCKVVR